MFSRHPSYGRIVFLRILRDYIAMDHLRSGCAYSNLQTLIADMLSVPFGFRTKKGILYAAGVEYSADVLCKFLRMNENLIFAQCKSGA